MLEAFEHFRPDEKNIEGVPEKWSDEFVLFQICEGRAADRDTILDNWTYEECIKWLMLKRYDGYVQREYMKP